MGLRKYKTSLAERLIRTFLEVQMVFRTFNQILNDLIPINENFFVVFQLRNLAAKRIAYQVLTVVLQL